MKVLSPEPESDLATDSSAQELTHGVLGGERLGKGLLHKVRAHEDVHLLGRIAEADGGVVLEGDGGTPADLDSVDPGSYNKEG